MDQELAALVSKFQALQRDDIAEKKINERNVVEIVMALKQRNLINIVYTNDGKEYLTWPQLKREVSDEVITHNGRLNICDLPAILNVDLTLIEQAVAMILAEDPSFLQLGGEIMTQQYVDSVTQDAQEELREHGSLSINEFAKTRQLSIEFITKVFTDSIEKGTFSALFDEVALFTPQFVRRQTHLVRTALLGAATPVNLNEFCDRHKILRQLFPKVLQHLNDSKQLPGRVEGGASGQYIPSAFEDQRTNAVTNLYSSNGVVSYTALQGHGVADPRTYMSTRFNPPTAASSSTAGGAKKGKGKKGKSSSAPAPSSELVVSSDEFPLAGYAMTTCFLADKTLKNLSPDIESVIAGDPAILDLADKLPTEIDMLNPNDADTVMHRLNDLHSELPTSCVLIANSIIVHSATIDNLKQQIEAVAREDLSRKGEGGKIRPVKGAELPPSARNDRKIKLLMAKALNIDVEDELEHILTDLYNQWEEKISSVYKEVAASIASSGAHNIKKLRAEYQAEVVKMWNEMCVWSKGLSWAQHNDFVKGDAAAHNKQLLSTVGANLVRKLLLDASTDNADIHEIVAEEQNKTPKQLLNHFSKKDKEHFQKIVTSLEGGNVEAFMESMEQLSSGGEINVPLHPPNKRLERELTAEVKTKVVAAVVEAEISADDAAKNAETFSAVCTFYLNSKCRALLPLQGKLVGGAVNAINGEEEFPLLMEAHKAVVDALRSGSVGGSVTPLKELLAQARLEASSSTN